MKFVALVSGGKDSCFNIVHCLKTGHELVAMANLHPKSHRPDEIDSWMFQTVGYTSVDAIAKCAGVPLFKAEISENEELVIDELAQLFNDIKAQGVEFSGISVGAIGSTYQQIRVDKACAACNLRSLTYLWQRDQADLLHEINLALDARIVKVAGMGLNQRHLGMKLRDAEPELLALHSKFGLHPCGEGGEYETMVFDAPFFTSKLEIVDQEVVQHSTDDVFYLKFNVKTVPKPEESKAVSGHIPPLLEPFFASLPQNTPEKCTEMERPSLGIQTGGGLIKQKFSGSFEETFASIESTLESEPIDAFHVIVILKDMARFAEMNERYIQVFSQSKNIPPSRACLQAAIENDVEVTIYAFKSPDVSGKGIHVQGLSYWAPASIGPYSQCRMQYGISYVAGQIGLIPQTLELSPDFQSEARLALQNAFRILDVIHETRQNWQPALAIAYITDIKSIAPTLEIWKSVSTLPLVHFQVENLPRNANVEWCLQACDLRYFAYFIPESDEEEEFYKAKPELYISKSKHVFQAGFQTREVTTEPLPKTQFAFSTNKSAGTLAVSSIHYDGIKVPSIYIN